MQVRRFIDPGWLVEIEADAVLEEWRAMTDWSPQGSRTSG